MITLPAVIVYCSTLSGTGPQILTPKRYDEHLCHFYMGVPLPPGQVSELEYSSRLGRGRWIEFFGKKRIIYGNFKRVACRNNDEMLTHDAILYTFFQTLFATEAVVKHWRG